MTDDMYKRIFSKNLRYYMSLNHKEQIDLINDLGFNKSAVSTWCNGTRLPRMDKVDTLARYFHINRSDLIEERSSSATSQSRGVTINVYGRVAAGIPLEAVQDIIDTEEIPEELAKTGEFFGLKIQGDSMEPDIHNGDTVIVRKQEDAESDEIVIALVNGNDGVCKRLKKYNDSIALISLNPNYEPMYFNQEEISKKPVQIVGKVVELRRKF